MASTGRHRFAAPRGYNRPKASAAHVERLNLERRIRIMKHLRLGTFLVFAVCAFSLPTMAQMTQKTITSQSALPATSLNGKITHKDTGLTVLTVGVRPI